MCIRDSINLAKKDNLTIERPRIEVQFLPERYTRTGRKLAVTRTKTELVRKRELYEVELTVNANILADDRALSLIHISRKRRLAVA